MLILKKPNTHISCFFNLYAGVPNVKRKIGRSTGRTKVRGFQLKLKRLTKQGIFFSTNITFGIYLLCFDDVVS